MIAAEIVRHVVEGGEQVTLRQLFQDNEPEQWVLDQFGQRQLDVPLRVFEADPATLTLNGSPLPEVADEARKSETWRIVKGYMRHPGDPIVLEGKSVLDGQHRAMAAHLAGRKVRAVDVDQLGLTEAARRQESESAEDEFSVKDVSEPGPGVVRLEPDLLNGKSGLEGGTLHQYWVIGKRRPRRRWPALETDQNLGTIFTFDGSPLNPWNAGYWRYNGYYRQKGAFGRTKSFSGLALGKKAALKKLLEIQGWSAARIWNDVSENREDEGDDLAKEVGHPSSDLLKVTRFKNVTPGVRFKTHEGLFGVKYNEEKYWQADLKTGLYSLYNLGNPNYVCFPPAWDLGTIKSVKRNLDKPETIASGTHALKSRLMWEDEEEPDHDQAAWKEVIGPVPLVAWLGEMGFEWNGQRWGKQVDPRGLGNSVTVKPDQVHPGRWIVISWDGPHVRKTWAGNERAAQERVLDFIKELAPVSESDGDEDEQALWKEVAGPIPFTSWLEEKGFTWNGYRWVSPAIKTEGFSRFVTVNAVGDFNDPFADCRLKFWNGPHVIGAWFGPIQNAREKIDAYMLRGEVNEAISDETWKEVMEDEPLESWLEQNRFWKIGNNWRRRVKVTHPGIEVVAQRDRRNPGKWVVSVWRGSIDTQLKTGDERQSREYIEHLLSQVYESNEEDASLLGDGDELSMKYLSKIQIAGEPLKLTTVSGKPLEFVYYKDYGGGTHDAVAIFDADENRLKAYYPGTFLGKQWNSDQMLVPGEFLSPESMSDLSRWVKASVEQSRAKPGVEESGGEPVWTRQSSEDFLAKIQPKLKEIGWKGTVVGGVAKRGWSKKDLDILLQPISGEVGDFVEIDNFIASNFPGAESLDIGAEREAEWNCHRETWSVDADGKAVEFFIRLSESITAYHASPNKFNKFNTDREGAHFGSREQASNVRKSGLRDPKQYVLDIENPLRMRDIGVWNNFNNLHAELARMGAIDQAEADAIWQAWQRTDAEGWNALKGALEAKGYDGIVYENEQEGPGDSYIAFRGEQIKPAPMGESEDDFDWMKEVSSPGGTYVEPENPEWNKAGKSSRWIVPSDPELHIATTLTNDRDVVAISQPRRPSMSDKPYDAAQIAGILMSILSRFRRQTRADRVVFSLMLGDGMTEMVDAIDLVVDRGQIANLNRSGMAVRATLVRRSASMTEAVVNLLIEGGPVTPERLERVYNKLYKRAGNILKKANPCKVEKGPEGVTCAGHKSGWGDANTLCCGGCKHHDPEKGCTAEDPLTCKTWLCPAAGGTKTRERLYNLAKRAERLSFYHPRQDKASSMMHARDYWDYRERKKAAQAWRDKTFGPRPEDPVEYVKWSRALNNHLRDKFGPPPKEFEDRYRRRERIQHYLDTGEIIESAPLVENGKLVRPVPYAMVPACVAFLDESARPFFKGQDGNCHSPEFGASVIDDQEIAFPQDWDRARIAEFTHAGRTRLSEGRRRKGNKPKPAENEVDWKELVHKPPLRTFEVTSSWGQFRVDENGSVISKELHPRHTPEEEAEIAAEEMLDMNDIVRFDVDEWKKTYPGEDPVEAKYIDILDLGCWDKEGNYFEPEYEWREGLEDDVADNEEEDQGGPVQDSRAAQAVALLTEQEDEASREDEASWKELMKPMAEWRVLVHDYGWTVKVETQRGLPLLIERKHGGHTQVIHYLPEERQFQFLIVGVGSAGVVEGSLVEMLKFAQTYEPHHR